MSMVSDARLTLLASYNQWMNRRLYDAAARLPHDTLAADRGAFFGSILGTLNHLVVTDTIWLKRFAAAPGAAAVLAALDDTPMPTALDAMPYQTLSVLRERRDWLDAMILRWVGTLTPAQLSARLTYVNTKGTAFTRSAEGLLTHLFNHQTHHRGQVTTLLSQAGVDVGVTDLLALVPEEG
ncbi:DinB family protein [Pseudoxanthomonas sp. LARHCG66]|jgi:uncharacterized damage-inducible protein DinB